jgi:hypothetical protein
VGSADPGVRRRPAACPQFQRIGVNLLGDSSVVDTIHLGAEVVAVTPVPK